MITQADLEQFTGTVEYHGYDGMLLTDGVQYLLDNAEAYWLVSLVASHLPRAEGDFAVAELRVNPDTHKANFSLHDGNQPQKTWATQHIEYTSFPLELVKLYVILGLKTVILLPSEY